MKIIIKNAESAQEKQMTLVNSKGRETPLPLQVALNLWRAGIAIPDSLASRCIIRGYY